MGYITVERMTNGWLRISDSSGNKQIYWFYNKRKALRHFKMKFGWRYKRDVLICDITKEIKQ